MIDVENAAVPVEARFPARWQVVDDGDEREVVELLVVVSLWRVADFKIFRRFARLSVDYRTGRTGRLRQ